MVGDGRQQLDRRRLCAVARGNTFRCDATAKQYIFNLGAKTLSSGTWYLRVDLGDNIKHVVQFRLKQ